MKKTLYIIAALAAMISCGPKGPRSYTAVEDKAVNIGKIKEIDGPVTFKLVAKNTFADTLFPVRISTQCGCTAAETDKRPIPPGQDEIIEITYNPAYRPGDFNYDISVMYKDSPVAFRNFSFMGNVKGFTHPIEEDRPYNLGENFYSSHKVLAYGSMKPGQTRDVFFRYGNGNKKKKNITLDIPEEWKPYIRYRQPGTMKADQRDTLHVKFTLPEGIDSVKVKIQPMVDGKPSENGITVLANLRK